MVGILLILPTPDLYAQLLKQIESPTKSENGKSAYEIWLELGNKGFESDILNTLKGEKGEAGEQGVPRKKGDTEADDISPTIGISESTDTTYKLQITDANGSFETLNLKGADGTGFVILDSQIFENSENPVQNKVIAQQLKLLAEEITKLNELIEALLSGSDTKRKTIFSTFDFSSQEQTIETYDDKIYIWELADDRFKTLAKMVADYKGTEAQNNYISKENSHYGIAMWNWSGISVDTKILFLTPITFLTDLALFNFTCTLSGWMNQNLNLRLIAAKGTSLDEIIENINEKVTSEDYAYSNTFVYNDVQSDEESIIKCDNILTGTYYLVIDGTTKADNSNFTYIKLSYTDNMTTAFDCVMCQYECPADTSTTAKAYGALLG